MGGNLNLRKGSTYRSVWTMLFLNRFPSLVIDFVNVFLGHISHRAHFLIHIIQSQDEGEFLMFRPGITSSSFC